MTEIIELTSKELKALPVLDVQIPEMKEKDGKRATHVFNIGETPKKYTLEGLKKKTKKEKSRNDFFEKIFLGIWLSTDRRPVPYAFRTEHDQMVRSLDAGCLGFLMNRSNPLLEVSELDDFGYVKALSPSQALLDNYNGLNIAGLTNENLIDRVRPPLRAAQVQAKESGPQPLEMTMPTYQATEPEAPLGFDPFAVVDERKKEESLSVRREGQKEFIKAMRANWGARCLVTKTTVTAVLDAAHIFRYGGTSTNDPRNGLLLRTDIHRLFDSHLVSFSYEGANLVFHVSGSLKAGEYGQYDGQIVTEDELPSPAPHPRVIEQHYFEFLKRKSS